MTRRSKLARYAENARSAYLIEEGKPLYTQLKGQWYPRYFSQDVPITVELGCGRAEYTLGLAARYRRRNFVGVDYKGARLWAGSRQAADDRLQNVAFLRAKIEALPLFFAQAELDTIYLTFPDPYPKARHAARRLSGLHFLRMYAQLLRPGGEVILKTDAQSLYVYTLQQLEMLNIKPQQAYEDLHAAASYAERADQGLISTYERRAMAAGLSIYCLHFTFGGLSHSSLSSSSTSAKKP